MELILDLVKIVLPAALVLYAVFLVVKSFLNKEYENKIIELKLENNKIILPIRLQAYERMCLFLERISPNNLLIRVNEPQLNSVQLQQIMLMEIRNEFNHNLSQQLYISNESWTLIKKAVEDMFSLINSSAEQVANESRSIELARKMIENLLNQPNNSIESALNSLKNEIRVVF